MSSMKSPAEVNALDTAEAGLEMRQGLWMPFRAPFMLYSIECLDKNGDLKWNEVFHNLVTTVGKNDLLTQYFKGSAYTAGWFVGLKNAGTAAVTDTMSAHAGWTEFTNYSIGANTTIRGSLTLGTAASGSIDNSANKTQFTITGAGGTVAGAFVTTSNAKSGTAGTLYSAGDFAGGPRGVVVGDTLNVTVTLSAT
jgi:hypothetical protein